MLYSNTEDWPTRAQVFLECWATVGFIQDELHFWYFSLHSSQSIGFQVCWPHWPSPVFGHSTILWDSCIATLRTKKLPFALLCFWIPIISSNFFAILAITTWHNVVIHSPDQVSLSASINVDFLERVKTERERWRYMRYCSMSLVLCNQWVKIFKIGVIVHIGRPNANAPTFFPIPTYPISNSHYWVKGVVIWILPFFLSSLAFDCRRQSELRRSITGASWGSSLNGRKLVLISGSGMAGWPNQSLSSVRWSLIFTTCYQRRAQWLASPRNAEQWPGGGRFCVSPKKLTSHHLIFEPSINISVTAMC